MGDTYKSDSPGSRSSGVFDGCIGRSVAASDVAPRDYLIDPDRFPSEGNWAFCRFDSEEIPALRLGFQRGGFNGGFVERDPSRLYLQLHLEIMTREGAILWLPSGMYRADHVMSDRHSMNIHLEGNSRRIFSFRGWPRIECHMSSDDGELQVDLEFALARVTVLPDGELPYCLFGMWESMGSARGSIRHRDRTTPVNGTVFFDHTRVLPRRHLSPPRHRYVYTTVFFEDGSGLFGYHSVDAQGTPIAGYCFHVHLDAQGNGELIEDSVLRNLTVDQDGIADGWEIVCGAASFSLIVTIRVRPSGILRSWGSPDAPQSRKDFSIVPLVLDGSATLQTAGRSQSLKAYGLAEYFDSRLWPADKAAASV
jgi:hypothetical protein